MLVLREEGRGGLEACRGPARLHLRRVRRSGEQTHGRRHGRRPATERRADALAQTSDARPKTSARRRASSRRSVNGRAQDCELRTPNKNRISHGGTADTEKNEE